MDVSQGIFDDFHSVIIGFLLCGQQSLTCQNTQYFQEAGPDKELGGQVFRHRLPFLGEVGTTLVKYVYNIQIFFFDCRKGGVLRTQTQGEIEFFL